MSKIILSLSFAGYELIKHFEGLVLTAYDDARPKYPLRSGDRVQGTLTIGYGHTGKDFKIGQTITPEYAQKLLEADVLWAINDVNRLTVRQPSQQQFDAMVVFIYNIGTPAFSKSTMLTRFNEYNDKAAAEGFKLFHKTTIAGQKEVSDGLCRRRFSEAWLYEIGTVNKNVMGWAEFYRTKKEQLAAERKKAAKK